MWHVNEVPSLCDFSRSHVDTVQKVSDGVASWRHICWSRTVKELGSRVTFVRRSSASKATLSNTYSDMKVWSCMFAMNVRSVSVHQLTWEGIRSCTLTWKIFAVVFVAKTSSDHTMLKSTLDDVLMPLNSKTCCDNVSVQYVQLLCACVLNMCFYISVKN